MHINLHDVFLICSLVFGVLATGAVPSPPRFQWFPAAFTSFVIAAFFV